MAGEGALVEDVDEDVDEEVDKEVDEELDEDLDDDEVDLDDDGIEPDDTLELDDDEDVDDDSDDDDDETEDEEAPVALDALEAEELEIVETDESATMLVDEASEIMAIRREEMTMDVEADSMRGDEFVCQSCFLVLKSSQLANKRKMLCVDCA